jgi:superfamily II DNA or RNA helicase
LKAILSNRIYLEVDRQYEQFLKETLTYPIPSYHEPDKPILVRTYGVIRDGLITLPIGRMDLIPSGYEIIDKRVYQPAEFPQFKFPLRASQQNIYNEIEDNSIINAKPSWGKTFAGLAIAGKLAQKTLVVVHTVPLRNQWAREVQKVYGFEPGIIGSSKFNTKPPIVIGNVQSLYNCASQICKTFGTVFVDEVHHVPSNTFVKVVDSSYARYKIGLSGTLQRKDLKHVMLPDFFGTKIFTPPPENSMEPVIDVINSGIPLPEMIGPGAWAHRVNALCAMPEYRNLVLRLSDRYRDQGHKLLIVADRVEFLKECAEGRPWAVAITGDMQEGREEALAKIGNGYDELYGTTSIFKEGISQDILSALILGSPTNNEPMLEQLIGRIQRIVPGKLPPRVIDIKLDGWTAHNQFQTRLGHYMRKGYKINYL